jgi:hypothetical protein
MVKWANVRSKQLLEIKGIRCIYLKVLMIKREVCFIRAEIIGFDNFRRVQLHWRIQHLEEFPLVFRFEISGGYSTHPDLQFGIFSIAFGGLLHQGRNYRV